MNKKISAVIIVKNEEDKILSCLNSLKWTDEIVIVDDYSSDKTVEICKNQGARVILNESKGNFDRQRNLGIKEATGDWILQMDADEIVPIDTANIIRQAIEKADTEVAFNIYRRNFFLGYPLKYAGSHEYVVKIFRKDKAIYVGSSVHETLKVEGRIGSIEADIYHYPFNSIRQVIERWNFYTDVEASVFIKNKEAITAREIKYRLTWKSLKLFWKLYFRKKGYRDGMPGLAWCVLNVIGPQIKWLKIWEKKYKERILEDQLRKTVLDRVDTGERIILQRESPLMIARHLSAYQFSKDYAQNKSILDAGCGEGYGSFYLADYARRVLGVDYDQDVITFANDKYKKANLRFSVSDITKEINLPNEKFDLIVSFQVVEHIANTDIYFKNIKKLLKDDGIFICSTPNRLDASPGSVKPFNKFHINEYLFTDFTALLSNYFSVLKPFGLKRGGVLKFYRRLKRIGIFRFLPQHFNPVNNFYKNICPKHFTINSRNIEDALDFIIVCKK
jgi:glycosyltransferase involved in cell wall biosynthesis